MFSRGNPGFLDGENYYWCGVLDFSLRHSRCCLRQVETTAVLRLGGSEGFRWLYIPEFFREFTVGRCGSVQPLMVLLF